MPRGFSRQGTLRQAQDSQAPALPKQSRGHSCPQNKLGFEVAATKPSAKPPLIARVWVGITRETQAGDYLAYLKRTRVKAYREAEGNRGTFVLRRVCGGRGEFVLLSLWESWEAIRKFSRGEIEKQVPYPTDKDFLLEFDSKVTLYEVLVQP